MIQAATPQEQAVIHQLFDNIWQDYISLNPNVAKIHKELQALEGTIINDHIALRGFSKPGFGISRLAQPFIDLGYKKAGDYNFPQKKLIAIHLDPPAAGLPKVFISELKLEECSQDVQDIIHSITAQVEASAFEDASFLYKGKQWGPISYQVYQKLLDESEYAAWMYAFGFRANHFTVNVNQLSNFDSVDAINTWLKDKGYTLNVSGGEVKGGAEDKLAQSSTMADKVAIEFVEGIRHLPSCFYEFAYRYPLANGELFGGFVPDSANKIFESTNAQG